MDNTQAINLQREIMDRALEVVKCKRSDYSHGSDPFRNFRKSALFGVEPWRGVLIRLTDKMSRVESIMEKKGERAVKDETLMDVFVDMVNYACILAGLCLEELGELQQITKEEKMTELSKSPQELVKTLLDTHTDDPELNALLLSAAKAIERMDMTFSNEDDDG